MSHTGRPGLWDRTGEPYLVPGRGQMSTPKGPGDPGDAAPASSLGARPGLKRVPVNHAAGPVTVGRPPGPGTRPLATGVGLGRPPCLGSPGLRRWDFLENAPARL